jgi:hypothetical protein
MQDPDTTGNELARWLQEVGRRRAARRPSAENGASPAEAAPKKPLPRFLRVLLLAAAAALAFMPYLYADVQLKIYSLRSLIVFIFS